MIKLNQSLIEKKIREFQEGVDYIFAGETHKDSEKAPPIIIGDKEEKNSGYFVGYTLRSFDILSPRLKKTLRETLAKQAEILLSLDFQWAEGDGGTIASKFQANSNDNCYFFLVDQDDNFFTYHSEIGERKEGQFLIYYTELSPETKKKHAENYQAAQQAWAEKVQKNGGRELTTDVPLSGTKCWDCGEVISDEDINRGNYCVDNQRWNSWMDRTFAHGGLDSGKKCQSQKLKSKKRNSWRYHFEVAGKWEQKKEHEQSHPDCGFLCRDRLQKFHRQFSKNLVYLEKYLSQEPATEKRSKEIANTKKNLAEIEQRLSIMKSDQPQKYASCDIKCSECEQKLCLHKNCQVGQGCPPKNCQRRHKHKNKPTQKENNDNVNNAKNQEENLLQPANLTLIIGLGIGGILALFRLVIFWLKRDSKPKR